MSALVFMGFGTDESEEKKEIKNEKKDEKADGNQGFTALPFSLTFLSHPFFLLHRISTGVFPQSDLCR